MSKVQFWINCNSPLKMKINRAIVLLSLLFLLFLIIIISSISWISKERSEIYHKELKILNILEYNSLIKEKRISKKNSIGKFLYNVTIYQRCSYAKTKKELSLRTQPNAFSDVIKLIPSNSLVNLEIRRFNFLNPYKIKNNFVRVGYKNNFGWVNGNFINPTNHTSLLNKSKIDKVLSIIFPERTIIGKLFGLLGSIALSLLLSLSLTKIANWTEKRKRILLYIQISISFLYFLLKGNLLIEYSINDFSLSILIYLVLSYLTYLISNWIEQGINSFSFAYNFGSISETMNNIEIERENINKYFIRKKKIKIIKKEQLKKPKISIIKKK